MKEYKEGKCKKCCKVELMSPSRFVDRRCRECYAKYQMEYRWRSEENRKKDLQRVNRFQRNLRRQILEHYSGHVPAQCIKCGENRYQCLELDHINDDGAQHGKRLCKAEGYRAYRGVNSYIYRDIKKNNYPSGYQTLCANCHSIKTKGVHYGSVEYFKGY